MDLHPNVCTIIDDVLMGNDRYSCQYEIKDNDGLQILVLNSENSFF